MIRRATQDDLCRIVEMSEAFYPTTKYAVRAPFDAPSTAVLAQRLIEHGIMLVAEVEGKVVGMVGLVVGPFMFNISVNGAYEIVWWVEPEHQGSRIGYQLLKQVEEEAKQFENVVLIQMASLATSPPQVAKLYEKLGYVQSETLFTKVV